MNTKYTAWMIRNDGKAIACKEHIYVNPKNVEETLYAAQWLYENTRHPEMRQLALETVAAWAASVSDDENMISHVLEVISGNSYTFLSQEFVTEHAEEIKRISTEELYLTALCNEVAAELNQEFLRAYYGGLILTEISSKAMVFHISSVGFDWYKIIHSFVSSVDFFIEEIILVWDEEVTETENKFYLRLPVEAFLLTKTIPLIPENKPKGGVMTREIFAHLMDGSSLRHILWDIEISGDEFGDKLQLFSSWESRYRLTLSDYAGIHSTVLRDEIEDNR